MKKGGVEWDKEISLFSNVFKNLPKTSGSVV